MGASAWAIAMLLIIESHVFGCNGADSSISCIKSERDALLKFKHSLRGHSSSMSSWVGEDCCTWTGVGCNNRTRHVVKLDLQYPFPWSFDYYQFTCESCLRGEINPSLLNLTHLNYLDLSGNNFSGTQIPKFIGSLKNLKYLNLSSANFQGKVPHHLGNLSNLQYLDLNRNVALIVDELHWVSTLSSLKHLDLSLLSLTKASDWLSSINMLPFLTELHLEACRLPLVPLSPHINFTSLAILDLSENYFHSSIPRWLFNISNMQHLDLSRNDFHGSMPTEMGNYNLLEVLDLSGNDLEGEIPETLRNLCNLHELQLDWNAFSGEFFGTFVGPSGCVQNSLKRLSLSRNEFNGSLPDELEQFVHLESLDLSHNSFWGPIPNSIGSLSSLRELYLNDNDLNGSIPKGLGELSNLKFLDISYNSLDGVISEIHFSKLRGLIELRLDHNPLAFDVGPTWIPPFQLRVISLSSFKLGPEFPQWFKTQKNVSHLYMSNASISDSIPTWFENISSSIVELDLSHNQINQKLPKFRKLRESFSHTHRIISLNSNNFEGPMILFPSDVTELDLSDNFLCGHIPQTMGYMMPRLEVLALSRNQFNGSIPHTICEMKSLTVLDLSSNKLTGRLPQCWGKLPSLFVLDLGNNSLTGPIPTSLGSIPGLACLHLQNNRLQGKIPMSLIKLQSLLTLDLSENAFTGFIPPWIGENLTGLGILSVHSNMFHGEIPPQICGLDSLRILSLANNKLSGKIPPCFRNFTSMIDFGGAKEAATTDYVDFHFTYYENLLVYFKGIEREYTRTVGFLFSIDLSGNNFVGVIPEELMSLSSLQNLNLSHNSLIGHIPSKIGNLKMLESLDLSRNELSGLIPASISSLNFLSYLNLSFNNLSGPIPTGNQLQTLDDKSIYIGNEGLCGPPLKGCPEDELPKRHEQVEETSNEEFEIQWFYCGLGMGFLAGFVGVCSSLYFIDSWRHACFQSVEEIYNKLWVTFTIKANQWRRNFHGDK